MLLRLEPLARRFTQVWEQAIAPPEPLPFPRIDEGLSFHHLVLN
jgi:hypothetical protein